MDSERWRQVPGYEGFYEASDQGRVRSVDRRVVFKDGRSRVFKSCVLRPGRMGKDRDYHFVVLCRDGKSRTWPLHQIILLAFVGPRPDGLDTCHNNGNGLDNRLKNLRYDTHAKNLIEGAVAKLTENDVVAIRRSYSSRRRNGVELAEMYGVADSTIYSVINRQSWKHVP